MEKKRIVISKATKKRATPKGSQMFRRTEMVVYHSKVGKRTISETKHEVIF